MYARSSSGHRCTAGRGVFEKPIWYSPPAIALSWGRGGAVLSASATTAIVAARCMTTRCGEGMVARVGKTTRQPATGSSGLRVVAVAVQHPAAAAAAQAAARPARPRLTAWSYPSYLPAQKSKMSEWVGYVWTTSNKTARGRYHGTFGTIGTMVLLQYA